MTLLAFPPLALLLLALVARLQQGSWFAPGAFFALVWALLMLMPLTFAPDYSYSPLALWLIFGAALALYLGSLVGVSLGRSGAGGGMQRSLPVNTPGLIVLASMIGMLAVLVLLVRSGQGLSALTSWQGMAQTGRELSVARYQEGYEIPPLARLLMVGTYAAAVLGGMLAAATASRRQWLVALAPFIPALMYGTALTSRATLLYTAISWLSGYFAYRVARFRGRVRLFTPGLLMRAGVLAILVVVLFVVLQMVRYGWGSWEEALDVLDRLRLWFFGYLSAWSLWLEGREWVLLYPEAGRFTFAGIFNALGLHLREQGIYTDFAQVGLAATTNVFTLFRGLLQDFGLFGAGIFLLLVGFGAGLAYGRVVRGAALWMPVLGAFYSVTLWSHVTSLFNYNSLIFAWVLIFGVLLVAQGRRTPERSAM